MAQPDHLDRPAARRVLPVLTLLFPARRVLSGLSAKPELPGLKDLLGLRDPKAFLGQLAAKDLSAQLGLKDRLEPTQPFPARKDLPGQPGLLAQLGLLAQVALKVLPGQLALKAQRGSAST